MKKSLLNLDTTKYNEIGRLYNEIFAVKATSAILGVPTYYPQ